MQVLIFSKTDAGSNVLGQVLDTRLESEVLVVAYENLIFEDGLRTRCPFFQKWVWRQNLSPKTGTRDGKVRSLP